MRLLSLGESAFLSRRKTVQWAISVAVCGMLAASTQAATVWSGLGGDGLWSNGANWVGGNAPAATDDVQFAGTTNLAVVLPAGGVVANTISFSSTAGAFTFTGGTLKLGSTTTGAPTVVTNSSTSLVKFNVDVDVQYNSPSINANNLEFNGALGITRTPDFYINAGKTVVVNGVMSGAGNLYINGSTGSTLELNNNNTYTGSTTIQNTTTKIRAAQAFGSVTSEIAIGAGTANSAPTLLISNDTVLARRIRVVSASTGFTNVVKLGGDAAAESGFSGNVTLGSDNAAANTVTLAAAANGKVTFSGYLLRATGATGTADAVTITGDGTIVLSGAGNTYSGTTTVTSGTLLVDGTLTAGGAALSVKNGAKLGGTGTINRQVIIENGAKLLNSAAGHLNVDSLQLSDSSQIDWQFGGLNQAIVVNGNLVLDGSLNLIDTQNAVAGTYHLFTAQSITDNGLILANAPAGANYQLATTANSVDLVITPVPEAATIGLFGLAGLLLLARRPVR